MSSKHSTNVSNLQIPSFQLKGLSSCDENIIEIITNTDERRFWNAVALKKSVDCKLEEIGKTITIKPSCMEELNDFMMNAPITYGLDLTSPIIINEITVYELNKILKLPLRSLILSSNYHTFHDWSFLKENNNNGNRYLKRLRRLTVVGKSSVEHSCTRQLLSGMKFLNQNFSLDFLILKNYNFNTINGSPNDDMHIETLELENCSFNADAAAENTLKVCNQITSLSLENTCNRCSFLSNNSIKSGSN